jgi:hypothetical protein
MKEVIINFLNSLGASDLIGVIGALLGIIGILLSIYFYVSSKRERKPFYSTRGDLIVEEISSSADGIAITFHGIAQKRISISHVFFWNGGSEPIRNSDITKSDPLRIEIGSGAIVLSTTLLATTAAACSVRLSDPPFSENGRTVIQFDFEYLDWNDGFVAKIVHDGPPNQPISCLGKVIGGSTPKEIVVDRIGVRQSFGTRLLTMIIVIPVLVLPLTIAIWGITTYLPSWNIEWIGAVLSGLLGVVAGAYSRAFEFKVLPAIPSVLYATVATWHSSRGGLKSKA